MYFPQGRNVVRFEPVFNDRGCASEMSGGIPSKSMNAVVVPMNAWKVTESS